MNETGRKVFFWFRVYCSAAAAYFALVAVYAGYPLTAYSTWDKQFQPLYPLIVAAAVVYGAFAVVHAGAAVLPGNRYSWGFGIAVIIFGVTTCLFLPACIPLLIYWLKPETKAFLARKD
jgi:hypothetical protein